MKRVSDINFYKVVTITCCLLGGFGNDCHNWSLFPLLSSFPVERVRSSMLGVKTTKNQKLPCPETASSGTEVGFKKEVLNQNVQMMNKKQRTCREGHIGQLLFSL